MTGPDAITRTDWNGVFGMFEMEKAAEVVVAKAKQQGSWTPCSIEDMTSDLQRKGFVELVYREWLRKSVPGEPWTYNGSFIPSESFIERAAGGGRNKEA